MSSDLVKAIAKVRLLKQQRSDVHPSKLVDWQRDYSAASWHAVAMFVKEHLGDD